MAMTQLSSLAFLQQHRDEEIAKLQRYEEEYHRHTEDYLILGNLLHDYKLMAAREKKNLASQASTPPPKAVRFAINQPAQDVARLHIPQQNGSNNNVNNNNNNKNYNKAQNTLGNGSKRQITSSTMAGPSHPTDSFERLQRFTFQNNSPNLATSMSSPVPPHNSSVPRTDLFEEQILAMAVEEFGLPKPPITVQNLLALHDPDADAVSKLPTEQLGPIAVPSSQTPTNRTRKRQREDEGQEGESSKKVDRKLPSKKSGKKGSKEPSAFYCETANCNRRASRGNPFNRLDNFNNHLRSVHNLPIPKKRNLPNRVNMSCISGEESSKTISAKAEGKKKAEGPVTPPPCKQSMMQPQSVGQEQYRFSTSSDPYASGPSNQSELGNREVDFDLCGQMNNGSNFPAVNNSVMRYAPEDAFDTHLMNLPWMMEPSLGLAQGAIPSPLLDLNSWGQLPQPHQDMGQVPFACDVGDDTPQGYLINTAIGNLDGGYAYDEHGGSPTTYAGPGASGEDTSYSGASGAQFLFYN